MSDDTTRRHLLRLTGTGLAVSVAGCASAAKELGSGRKTEAGSTSQFTGTATPSGTEAAAVASPSGGDENAGTPAAGTSSDDEWSPSSVEIDPPSTSFSDVPIPSQPDTRYARLGTGESPVTATLYGNWKCPYTQEFVRQQLPDYVERYVRPGDLTVEFRSLAYQNGDPFLGPDAPRAARMGLAVWDVDPESYWEYFAYVFANQPQERHEWGTIGLLSRFAEAADVRGTDRIARITRSGAGAGAVDATTGAAADFGIGTVPRLVVDGTVFAPTVDPDAARTAVERLIRG